MESKERFNPIEDEEDREPVEMISLIREKEGGKREIKIALRYVNKDGLVPAEGWNDGDPDPAYLVPGKEQQKPLTFARPIAAWRWLKIHSGLFRLVWPEPPEEEQEIPPEQLPLLEIK